MHFLPSSKNELHLAYAKFQMKWYHQQQNKWFPQRCLLAHFEATLDFSRSEFTCPYTHNHKLLWTSIFATAKIECGQVKWTSKHLWGTIYFAGDSTYNNKKSTNSYHEL